MRNVFAHIVDRLRRNVRRTNPVWRESTPAEVGYWEGVIRTRAAAGQLIAPEYDHSWLRKELDPRHGNDAPIRILNVGSGPFGLGNACGGGEIVATDPLGEIYNRLLAQFEFRGYPRIESVKAEDLSRAFGREAFHFVECSNALDHCENPARGFNEMIAVCKAGGLVRIVSFENEGEWERYQGLHYWNLRADSQGLWLSDSDGRARNLFAPFARMAKFRWRYLDAGQQYGRPVFEVLIHKH